MRNEIVGVSCQLAFSAPSGLLRPQLRLQPQSAVDDVAGIYDTGRMSVTVTSQVMDSSACYGICVNPSGRFPSDLRRPTGSLTASLNACRYTLARLRSRHTRSFKVWWRAVLQQCASAGECLLDRPWRRMGILMRLTKPGS